MMLQSLKHKLKVTTTITRLISGNSQLFRRLSTTTSPIPVSKPSENRHYISKPVLQKKLWAALNTSQTVSDVLHHIIRNGEQFTSADLLACIHTLRKYGHYSQCLEILEWMDKGRSENSAIDYGLRLRLMCHVKSIDDVEKYFDSIPPDAKNHYTYGAFLNCYCTKMMTDKALAVFKKMDELKYVFNNMPFNSLMDLYIKVGTPEKVPLLVEEMKQRKIPLTNLTYYIWIQSYRHAVDLEGLEQVMHEVQEQDSVRDDWKIYSNLAAVYIEAHQSEEANTALKRMEELFDNPRSADRKAYHYLISMYAKTGNLSSVYKAWEKLVSNFEVCQNASYLTMLRALSALDDIEGLKKLLEEWEMGCLAYDERLPAVVIGAYLRHDMLEEAEQLLRDIKVKADQQIKFAHVLFMNYFLEKHQFDSALKHMEAAMAAKWKPVVEKLDPFFNHFKEEKNVDSAEDFCQKLEKVQPLDSRTYLWLLQTYAAAGQTAPNMRQRMEGSGIDITPEHEELLQKICQLYPLHLQLPWQVGSLF